MAPKRKNSEAEDLTARERKKVKVAAARTIAVQPKIPGSTQNAKAGPSSVGIVNSMEGLPSALDVEKFAEARAFEISAMEEAMKNSSASSTSRAWQSLPRHLRRRAASHDVRRVPLRLREKARAEMDPVSKKAHKHQVPRLGKSKRLKRTEILQKRQADKVWLETHLWHAKRMHMENIWGYRLAVTPTEKSFRPSHRASMHGSILHDASYFATIELKGPETVLKHILDACCDPQGAGPGSKRYLSGARVLETHLYQYGSYPFGLIAPITVIWCPLLPSHHEPDQKAQGLDNAGKEQAPVSNGKNSKGKQKAMDPNSDGQRIVWLRVHPSAFDATTTALQSAASAALAEAKRKAAEDSEEIEVEIADLRGQINAFEIMGPKSNQVLKGALSPVCQKEEDTEFSKFWSSLSDVQSSGQLARGMVIGVKVYDPRLKFPPKNAKVETPVSSHTNQPMTVFPSTALARTEIWDDEIRRQLTRPRYKKKDLDERRAKNLVPGTVLKPQRQDDRIPVLVIQRSLKNSNSKAQGIHGWTLLIPAGWSMAFLPSLIYTGTRVGGQRERQTQAFEAGVPYFPRDLPSSTGYEAYSRAREEQERETWSRKPPAKHVNFEKLGTRNPWRANWEQILGLASSAPPNEEGLVTAQREDPMVTDPSVPIWLLRGVETRTVLDNMLKMLNPGAGLLESINQLRRKRGFEVLDTKSKSEELLQAALISVRIDMCKRGVPEDLAMIYALDHDEGKKWERLLQKNAANGDEEDEEVEVLSLKRPPQDSIIGYVTTGHFSLSQGTGFAIGTVSLSQLVKLAERGSTSGPGPGKIQFLVKIRNRDGQRCRPARIELLDESN